MSSQTVLAECTRNFQVSPGVIEFTIGIVGATVMAMSEGERVSAPEFDEISTDGKFRPVKADAIGTRKSVIY